MILVGGVCRSDFQPVSDETKGRFEGLGSGWKIASAGAALILHEAGAEGFKASADHIHVIGDFRLDNRTDLIRELGLSPENPDASIVLHGYRRWGRAIPEKLVGEFAFAIIDEPTRTVTLARDRLGVRCLYLALIDGEMVWCTVPSVIARHPRYRFEVDRVGVAVYMYHLPNGNERSLYDGIERLPAATTVTVSNGRIHRDRYWDPGRLQQIVITPGEAEEELRRRLAVSIRRRSEPGRTSLFLSGGLDSGALACLASREGMEVVPYTLRFPDSPEADEGSFLSAIQGVCGIERQEHAYGSRFRDDHPYSFRDVEKRPDLFYYPNLQFHGPQYRAMKSSGQTVALTGLGGDQLFSARTAFLDLFVLQWRSEGARSAMRGLKGTVDSEGESIAGALRRELLSPLVPSSIRFARDRWKRDSHLEGLRLRFILGHRLWRFGRRASFNLPPAITRAWIIDAMTTPPSLERPIEMTSLLSSAFGIDTRYPYLDHELVELVVSLPPEISTSHFRTKELLRRSMDGILPDLVRLRTDKAHFDTLFLSDLQERQRSLGEVVRERGFSPFEGLFDRRTFEAWFARMARKDDGWSKWLVAHSINLQLWYVSVAQGAHYEIG